MRDRERDRREFLANIKLKLKHNRWNKKLNKLKNQKATKRISDLKKKKLNFNFDKYLQFHKNKRKK